MRIHHVTLAVCLCAAPALGEEYYPEAGHWPAQDPGQLGLDAARLEAAVQGAREHEATLPPDLGAYLRDRFQGPGNEIVGPTKPRGQPNGLVIRHGRVAVEFGTTDRVDMCFSVTKSFLSTVAGLAVGEELIRNLDDPVSEYLDDESFQGPRHDQITWRHLLQQTSEWEGTLWTKPDTVDRRKDADRTVQAPGTFWEYNDVRVNLLAFALLQLWQRPLPEVLKERVMDPIGASDAWRWHGYSTSWVEIDGRRVQSVSGGGHWGGGMWISARDMARFGYLFLRDGAWRGERLLPTGWVSKATTKSTVEPRYGFMWWLNTDGLMWPDAPHDSFAAIGGGSSNVIWVWPAGDLVVVLRWMERDAVNVFLGEVVASVID